MTPDSEAIPYRLSRDGAEEVLSLQSHQQLGLALFCCISCNSISIPPKPSTLPQASGGVKGQPSESTDAGFLGVIDSFIASPDLTPSSVSRIIKFPLIKCYSQATENRIDVYRTAIKENYDIEHHESGSNAAMHQSECTSFGAVSIRINTDKLCISFDKIIDHYGRPWETEPNTPHSDLGDYYTYKHLSEFIKFQFTRYSGSCLGRVLISRKCYKGQDKPTCEQTVPLLR